MRALFGLFFAPWPVFAVLAILVFGGGYFIVLEERRHAAHKAESLLQGPPPLTDLVAFDFERDTRYNNEVNLEVYVDLSLNTGLTLTEVKKGTDRVEERMLYFVFDGSESKASGQARAVVMVNMDQTDRFAEYIAANSTEVEADKVLFALSGTALTGTVGRFDELVEKALVGAGLTKAPGFIVVIPWLNGREAALKTDPKDEALMIQFFGVVGGGLSLIALLKFLFRKRKSALVSQPTLREEAQSAHQLLASAPSVSRAAPAADSPEERAQRNKKLMTWAPIATGGAAFIYISGLNFFALFVVAGLYWLIYKLKHGFSASVWGDRVANKQASQPAISPARPKDPFDRLR